MNHVCRKCDSLEAQLAQLRDMAKQKSVPPPSEQVLSSFLSFTISKCDLFGRQETVPLDRQLKCVLSRGPLFRI